MKIKQFQEYPNAMASVQDKNVQILSNIIVIELDNNEWETMHLNGYGYTIYENNIEEIKQQMSNYSVRELKMLRQMYDSMDRDLWIYDLYLSKARSLPFIITLGNQEAFLINEGAIILNSKEGNK